MKAAVCFRYGPPDAVEIKDLPKPKPGPRDVLIKVLATTVSSGDARVRSANFPRGMAALGKLALGWSGPRQGILGTELAGLVEEVGRDVTLFKKGDAVIAYPGMKMGAHAEYSLMREDKALCAKPEDMSFIDASALGFGGLTALYFLRDRAKLQAGESVLVIGASGAVGVAAVQLARFLGGVVTGVCSGKNTALVKSLGAHEIVDYQKTDFTRDKVKYNVIMDCTGTVSAASCSALLQPNGRLILAAADLVQMLEPLWKSLNDGKKVITGTASERREDLQLLIDLAERGQYKSVIDQSFPLEEIAKAHALVDSGRKRGSVVVTID